MTDHKSDNPPPDVKGGLAHAPAKPTEEKSDPETGTGSADKRSPDSQVNTDPPADAERDKAGAKGGNLNH